MTSDEVENLKELIAAARTGEYAESEAQAQEDREADNDFRCEALDENLDEVTLIAGKPDRNVHQKWFGYGY